MKNKVIIYEKTAGAEVVRFDFEPQAETIWATVEQMAEVFEVDRTVISRHIRNIYACGELVEVATCAKNAQVREEGGRLVTRQVKKYNLDMIISVGYRVNSAKATRFRIWANRVLKDYIIKGVAVNERRVAELPAAGLRELTGTIGVIRRLMERSELSAGEANGILEVITKYAGSFDTLKEYERGRMVQLSRNLRQKKTFDETEVARMVEELRTSEAEGQEFGEVRDTELVGRVFEIFREGSADVPGSAAELLYIVAKGQPFVDGNKRLAALFFVVYLTFNDYNLAASGETKISDRALVALTLLMSDSEEDEKGLLIELTKKLLK